MYLIAKGECIVNIRDENNRMIKNHKILTQSDYFGEISMLYGCKRTATITSRKYSTLAKLTQKTYKEITTEFPEMVSALKKGIYKYNDRMKRFMKTSLKKIDFFSDLSDNEIHDVMYNMELKNY